MATATHDQIATRAFEIYRSRGGNPGHEMEDWLQAEKELKINQPASASTPRVAEEAKPQEQFQSRRGGRQPGQRTEQPSGRQM